ncbi:MAG: ABC transporter permease subunit [Anaerolineales bacterium]|nr:ABC transporter permease subunit [Anaerolineales bacterium]
MQNESASEMLTPKPTSRWNIFARMMENPVIMKELRGRMRGRSAPFLISGYLGLIGLVVGVIYASFSSTLNYTAWDPQARQILGKGIFGTVVLMELFLVSLIGPALTSGAISSERERQTLDLLRTTTLPARSFVLGKLGSSLAYLLLLIFTALPMQSIAFLLGGVDLAEMIISTLLLIMTAFFYCALGIFLSSFIKRTTAATVTAYVVIVLSYILLGVGFFVLSFISVAPFYYSSSAGSELLEALVTILLWILVSTNPLLTAIISEVILVEDQSLFFTSSVLSSQGLVLPSPWIIFLVIYIILTFLMIRLSIRFVARPDK